MRLQGQSRPQIKCDYDRPGRLNRGRVEEYIGVTLRKEEIFEFQIGGKKKYMGPAFCPELDAVIGTRLLRPDR